MSIFPVDESSVI